MHDELDHFSERRCCMLISKGAHECHMWVACKSHASHLCTQVVSEIFYTILIHGNMSNSSRCTE